jgi:SAM-dependent methyltransferase
MSVTDFVYRMLKYGMSKGRNFKHSEAIPSPAIVDRKRMATFIAELRTRGYDLANCAQRLGVIPRCGVNFSWMRSCDTWASVEADPVDTLLEVFIGGYEVPISRITAHLSSESVDAALEMRLLEKDGEMLKSRLCLFPCYGKFIATDRAQKNTAINQVMWLFNESFLLGGMVKRSPRRRGIDLGTGSGVHALLASDHCESVVGIDVNPRAIEFSRFNAALNGIKNVEFILSDLFNSLDPRLTFDLLTSNPPYVPDLATEAGDNFWSGGREGTGILRRVIEAIPFRLDDDGVANIISLYPIPPRTKMKDYFNQWLGGQVDAYEVLDFSWPVPRYQGGWSELPSAGNKSAWRWGVVSLRHGSGSWREAAGERQFFRNDGSCSLIADHDAFRKERGRLVP